ncbi:hypothetical protein MSPP1_000370 [Malassezia sp. CBS 17886]|nr:hypothetical protein MSPP1_000370 [Malassezia sp. CBS 17886]
MWMHVFSTFTWTKIPFAMYHPLLLSLGMYALAQGIFALQRVSSPAARKQRLEMHEMLMLGAALPLLTGGAWIMWHMHALPGRQHFISIHGTLGVVLVALVWMQTLFGASTVWFQSLFYGTELRARFMYRYHRAFGYALGLLLILELLLAFWETQWMAQTARTSLLVLLSAAVLVTAAGFAMRV